MKPTPGSQLALFATYSYHAFITGRDGDTLELEADHRRHAEIENAIRDLKYGVGLNHLPSGRFAANGAWLAVQAIAHNLARWTARIGLGEQIVATKTLRRRFFSIAGRLTPPGATADTALASALALGGPVHWRPDPVAHPAASLLTVASATGPPSSPSSTSQSKISPTRAARIGQRECPAAFGHLMSASSHRQQACYWPHPPDFCRERPLPIPATSRSCALSIRFGGFGLRRAAQALASGCHGENAIADADGPQTFSRDGLLCLRALAVGA